MIPGLETLIGSALGGLFRVGQRIIELREKDKEREHELRMTEVQGRLAAEASERQMRELGLRADISANEQAALALVEALKEQGATAQAAGGTAAFISATVRPIITYLFVLGYLGFKAATFVILRDLGSLPADMLPRLWGSEDNAILASIVTFWFVDRVYRRGQDSR